MYKYKQTTDVEIGDLVVWTELPPSVTNRINNKLYKVIGKTISNSPIIVDETGSEKMYGRAHGFKVLQTKPADQAVAGDYMYRITSGPDTFPQHTIIKITRITPNYLYYKVGQSVLHDEVIVIAQAEPEVKYPLFKEDVKLGFIFKYTGTNEGIYLTNNGIPNRKPGEYVSPISSEDNAGWKPCDFTIEPEIFDIDWWQSRYKAGLPVYYVNSNGYYAISHLPPKECEPNTIFSMTDISFVQQVPISSLHLGLCQEIPLGAAAECGLQPTIKEQPMKLQQLLDTIFGVSDYEAKPKFIVTVFNNDKEVATTTADSIEEIQQTIQSDTRLWGCKLVAHKIHSELQTQVPVTITKFKKESNASAE